MDIIIIRPTARERGSVEAAPHGSAITRCRTPCRHIRNMTKPYPTRKFAVHTPSHFLCTPCSLSLLRIQNTMVNIQALLYSIISCNPPPSRSLPRLNQRNSRRFTGQFECIISPIAILIIISSFKSDNKEKTLTSLEKVFARLTCTLTFLLPSLLPSSSKNISAACPFEAQGRQE
jgi:hypothetical protein